MPQAVKVILLLLLGQNVYSEEECIKSSVVSCNDCIKSGPGCNWCQALNFAKPGEMEAVRCDTVKILVGKGCPKEMIIDSPSTMANVQNKPLSAKTPNPVQVQPQAINLYLRPGHAYTFSFKFKRAEGYPVDLYYLMDLSYSMEDDLKNVKNLGLKILEKMQNITGNARIGFGSFVDKTLLPFTETTEEKLKKPCPAKAVKCQPAFGYQHVLSLTQDRALYSEMVSKQDISGNLDVPEGSLDAIMQVATCVNQIGWGNSTRLLVLATDAGFHMAGDGKLAGLLEPNQETCQLDKNNMYSKSNIWDYPSVGQIARKLEEQNIQPIFAVTEDVSDIYKDLTKLIPKSEVGVLSTDSSNVVKLIEDAYNKLSSNIIVTYDTLPDDISVTFTSNCEGGGTPSDKGTCNNVNIRQEVIFNVTVKAAKCLSNVNFNIGPLGFNEKLNVAVSTRCNCECDNQQGEHEYCNNKGTVTCGICSCNSGFLGQRCECSLGQKDETQLKQQCRKENGTECEGRGDCECGVCKCHQTEKGNSYYGQHCDCDDEHCEKYQNKLCGGNGDCRCGFCKCYTEYEGTACQCLKSEVNCITNETQKTVCHGRGKCVCNQCVCERGYKGLKCETCPTCKLPCQESGKCVECKAFGTGPFEKNCTAACPLLLVTMEENLLKRDCQVKDSAGCWMFFSMMEQDGFDRYNVKVLRSRECPEGPNVGLIVGASLAGVALIGILLLALIKLIVYFNDLKEWRRFEKEAQRRQWAKGENPLFQKATTTVANPAFTGDS